MHYARANQEIYTLLRDRVEVSVRQPDGTALPEKLSRHRLGQPREQRFPPRLPVLGPFRSLPRRADLVGFVNGIPLVFIELKASHRNLKHAYDDNLSDYRDTIPHLFAPNGFIILSNGADTKVGTITSGWEFFSEWKKINSEGEQGVVSLETVIRGMCTKERASRSDRELRCVPGSAWRASSSCLPAITSTSVSTTHSHDWRSCGMPRRKSGASLACSGTLRARARRSRCCSSPRRCCARCPGTGLSSSSPTAKTSTSRRTRSSSWAGSSPSSTSGRPARLTCASCSPRTTATSSP